MGKWDRRYLPRRKFKHYDYDIPPSSPPRPYDNNNNHSYPSGFEGNRVPSWEIDYCNSVKVPWRKIMASKKYIYCYPTVLDWDASAGEEALQNAKQRYWATINNLPCDNPLPNPDIYIGEIDWNPYLDPELMADLDRQAFDPDKVQNVENSDTNDKNQSTNDNPWERDPVQGSGSLKDAAEQGWSRWDDSANVKKDNPWEQSCSEHVDSLKNNCWKKSGNESWGWQQGNEKLLGFDNSCNYVRQEGWGQRENSNNRGGWVRGNCNGEGFNNRNESWNQRESEYRGNEPKYWDTQGFRGGGCRKREGFQQDGSKFKSSRNHGDSWR
ncbi:hypothetical protein CASFOL_033984 [Castilleja foliolosa]|uniref:Uncharacterized protein n=1 Tax=Castilleja foliolosa TaxID=1961234 RepID=A0ABD3BYH9_9LAMI